MWNLFGLCVLSSSVTYWILSETTWTSHEFPELKHRVTNNGKKQTCSYENAQGLFFFLIWSMWKPKAKCCVNYINRNFTMLITRLYRMTDHILLWIMNKFQNELWALLHAGFNNKPNYCKILFQDCHFFAHKVHWESVLVRRSGTLFPETIVIRKKPKCDVAANSQKGYKIPFSAINMT